MSGADLTTDDARPPAELPAAAELHLEVLAVADVTPGIRGIRLGGPDLASFRHAPGQDVLLVIPQPSGGTVRRRFTIRRFDAHAHALDVEIAMHGSGPAMRWAAAARTGDTIDAVGPRGKITISPTATWHLFAGDATAVPGALAMVEFLPPAAPAIVRLAVDGPSEERALERPGSAHLDDIRWLHASTPEGRTTALVSSLASLSLPAGDGHAYLAGEVTLVRAMTAVLRERGVPADHISAKGYWRSGRANAEHGEPERTP